MAIWVYSPSGSLIKQPAGDVTQDRYSLGDGTLLFRPLLLKLPESGKKFIGQITETPGLASS